MPKPLPPLHPQLQAQVDNFHAACEQVLDHYISGVERDMNRHAVKHGPMDEARMVTDFTRILVAQVNDPDNDLNVRSVCGMLSLAIARGIAKKRQGRG